MLVTNEELKEVVMMVRDLQIKGAGASLSYKEMKSTLLGSKKTQFLEQYTFVAFRARQLELNQKVRENPNNWMVRGLYEYLERMSEIHLTYSEIAVGEKKVNSSWKREEMIVAVMQIFNDDYGEFITFIVENNLFKFHNEETGTEE
jgi:hypothetical protein